MYFQVAIHYAKNATAAAETVKHVESFGIKAVSYVVRLYDTTG